jgi:hypothetical protein
MSEEGGAVVQTACAKLVVTGPCRTQGDAYLKCVLTRGKGACQLIRHLFEGCAHSQFPAALDQLQLIAKQVCPHETDPNKAATCAATIITGTNP